MKNKKPKVVVIGGGNGSAIVINALKKFISKIELCAVVSASDSGGSSGALRWAFNMPPPGDVLRAVLGMSRHDYNLLRQIFYRNRIEGLEKFTKQAPASRAPNLGNLILSLLTRFEGDFMSAVKALEKAVEAVGRVYPATLEQSDVCAKLTNNKIIKGETNLDRPIYSRQHKIKKLWLEPAVKIFEPAKKALEQANYIFLSPGSLYTSVVATLLPRGAREAIKKSNAKLIYVAGNGYEKLGETGPEKLSDFVKELERFLPRPIDLVIYNNCELNKKQKRKYLARNWGLFEADLVNLPKNKVISADFEKNEGGLSWNKLGVILQKLI